jgi:hypothetical protein
MALDLMQERERARAYIDNLPPEQLSAVRGLLEAMVHPTSRAIANAPFEDEVIGEEEERTVAAAREWLQRNQGIPHEEVLAEFGLTLDDFEKMAKTPLSPQEHTSDD